MSFRRIILDLNREIDESSVQIQNLERRVKELESQDNPLGIIEPGNDDPLITDVIKIQEFVSVRENVPNQNLFNDASGLSMFFSTDVGNDKWALFKFPTQLPKAPEIMCLPSSIWTASENSSDKSFAFNWEVLLIKTDFDVKVVTWNIAQAFSTIDYTLSVFSGKDLATHPADKPQRLCVDNVNSFAKTQPGPYFGFLLKGEETLPGSSIKGSINAKLFNVDSNDKIQRAFIITAFPKEREEEE